MHIEYPTALTFDIYNFMCKNLVLYVVHKITFKRVVNVVENKSTHGIRWSCVRCMFGADQIASGVQNKTI